MSNLPIQNNAAEVVTESASSLAEPQTLAQQFNVPRRLHAFGHYAETKAALSPEERMAVYRQEKQEFETALSVWEPTAAEQVRDLLESQRSVDWADIAVAILDSYRSRGKLSILDLQLEQTYNANRAKSDPEFANMQRVNQFLKSSDEAPSVNRLMKVHSIAMRGGVEDLRTEDLGVIRDYAVVGFEKDKGLSDLEVRRISKNPYLTFQDDARYARRAAKTGRRYGEIVYPEPMLVKAEALERIMKSHSTVYEAVIDFKSQSNAEQVRQADELTAEYRKLTRELVKALIEQVYAYHAEKRGLFVDLDTPQKVIGYVKQVALQEREAISVHPLPDGNGRSLRAEILNDLLDKVGISRPRLTDPNKDFLLPPSGWVTQVQKGILSTDAVYRDFTKRIRLGLRVESSPELLFPDLPRTIGIDIRSRGRKAVERNVTQMPLKHAQFGAFVDARLTMEPALYRQFKADPVETMGRLREEYKTLAKKSFVYTHIPKTEKFGLSGVHLVDFDFRATIGVPFAVNPERWAHKIDTWYNRSLVWRGMSDESPIAESQILSMFTQFSWLGLSNTLVDYWDYPHEDIREWVQDEFTRYNEAVINGTLKHTVTDHISEGEGYHESFGFSTSKSWSTARGFAWGRGTYGYNDKEVKEAQSSIGSRVLVGGYSAYKDIDVGRLRFIDPEFRYNIAQRQQEVMGVGAWDPDAIMVVQTINEKKQVERSWIRNPSQPSEVWLIDGGCDFSGLQLTSLPDDVVLNKIQLSC
jgi:hypothetical protein